MKWSSRRPCSLPEIRPELPPVAPAGSFRRAFSCAQTGSAPNSGNKKAEQKPRFLYVAICRRSIRGRLIINHYFLAKEYDGNTTVLEGQVFIFPAIMRPLCETLHIRFARMTPRHGPLLAA